MTRKTIQIKPNPQSVSQGGIIFIHTQDYTGARKFLLIFLIYTNDTIRPSIRSGLQKTCRIFLFSCLRHLVSIDGTKFKRGKLNVVAVVAAAGGSRK